MKNDDFDWIYIGDQVIVICIIACAMCKQDIPLAILALGLMIKNEFAHDRKLRTRESKR